MDRSEIIAQQAARIRAEDGLGRSQALARLFDYLADPAHEGRALSEADVAQDVFGRAVDLPGDASVRVYVHRLRRKLEAYYAGPGADAAWRLILPVGQYRLEVEAARDGAPADEPVRAARPRWLAPVAAGACALVLANLAAWAWVAQTFSPERDLARAADSPLWAGLGRERPVVVVVGDYYIFGDTEHSDTPRRMVRDFEINSPAELDAWLMDNPEQQGRYVDLDTYYTPVGATLALRDLMPLVRRAAGGARRVTVMTASHLTPETLKTADVVYVGYLSGLHVLQTPVFARSRFAIGATYDELVDRRTGQTYVSGAGQAQGDRPNRDYGYLAAFRGPNGNRFVIVAGNRDIGVAQMAEVAADPAAIRALGVTPTAPVEALYEVDGVGRTAVGARPVVAVR